MMPIDPRQLLNRVKTELRISGSNDDPRLCYLIAEAAHCLQQFKCKTLVDTVSDAATETTLSPLDVRYIVIYVALQFDAADDLAPALGSVLELVRDR
jgi:hypothetical protein